ncbi:MAG TPA: haloacid dehalogenase-like hydrolase [Actinophytocola sp.]|uniref:HAD family hydrolase n=1 Tax=Actinophytocola sp. TaxID=1872138 RepID=UPI002DBA9424|nr:haloacid dehalogenase-like hydrolase [Actinophytocola sp.]HEU5475005.1 haloacid dehalogenase-like hydrolase [Actinophytocola sp.]
MILVLWDIDQTLVDYSGVGRRWYAEAISNVLGIDLLHMPEFAGRTERALAAELLALHGARSEEEDVQRVFAELVRLARADRPDLATLGRALPGAAEALAELAGRGGVLQSLVTGNLPELAGLKLEPFGLDRYVDLEVGGYGAISLERHHLVAEAMTQAAAKYGRRYPPDSVVVVGDTPLDMLAGRHHGTVTVGVTTGRYDADALHAAGATVVLPGLADTSAVLAAVLSA